MTYELTLEAYPEYMHATVRGRRTPENAERFLREAYNACMESGHSALLIEMRLQGPSIATPKIFEVISGRSEDGRTLRKIAYVEVTPADPGKVLFAETVARNRGVNVRHFADIAAAARWLRQEEER